mgnify:CR=1 FL=1
MYVLQNLKLQYLKMMIIMINGEKYRYTHLIVIDPSYKSFVGHHGQYIHSIRTDCENRNLFTTIFAHQNINLYKLISPFL